jgi:hypothetical protein
VPDRIDAAVSRLERANSHQRRIEATAIALLIVFVVVFQLGNRATFLGAQNKANHDADVQRKAFSKKLDEQGVKLDEANRRVGQLEAALEAAGLRVPDPLPPDRPASSTTTTTTPGRTTTTFFPPPTTTTTRPSPSTTSTSSPSSTTTTAPPPTCQTLPPPIGRCLP